MGRVAALPLVAALLVVLGCGSREGPPPQPDRVLVVKPVRQDLTRSLTLPGDLIGINEAALHAKVTGYLHSIAVDKGDRVKKGQVLAVLEVPELKQRLEGARAELTVRRLTYDRINRVWREDPRVISREEVDVAEGAFRGAKAEVERLEALWGYTNIVAPFDGVVTARYVDPGALIAAAGQLGSVEAGGTLLAKGPAAVVTVADVDIMRVYVYVPSSDAGYIRDGLPATVRVKQYPQRTFAGTVTRFAKALEISTRTMLTEIDIANPNHEVYPGMAADVALELERHPDALTVPTTAVGRDGGGQFVFLVKDGRVERVPIATGLAGEAVVEVVSGLGGSESVVRYISERLVPGEAVEAVSGDAH